MKKIEVKDSVSIIYNEDIISVNRNNNIKVLCNERCSTPSLNSKNNKFIYLSPLEWEEISKLKLYDIENDILKEIKINNISGQDTIKQVQWMSDNKLIMIVGFANGTITVGGDIFTYNLSNNEFKKVYKSLENEEVKKFTINHNVLKMEIAHFNDNYDGYKIRNESIQI